jgi:hypothetical protein
MPEILNSGQNRNGSGSQRATQGVTMAHPRRRVNVDGCRFSTAQKQKAVMAKRTDTKVGVLAQVMDEIGFDQETIARVCGMPQRTVSDTVNRRGRWRTIGDYNELRETYRLLLRKHIRDDAEALGLAVLRRLDELAQNADLITALRIANAVADLALRFEDGR